MVKTCLPKGITLESDLFAWEIAFYRYTGSVLQIKTS